MIQTEDAPAAIGPYSQAVAAGPYLFLSGQIPPRSQGRKDHRNDHRRANGPGTKQYRSYSDRRRADPGGRRADRRLPPGPAGLCRHERRLCRAVLSSSKTRTHDRPGGKTPLGQPGRDHVRRFKELIFEADPVDPLDLIDARQAAVEVFKLPRLHIVDPAVDMDRLPTRPGPLHDRRMADV